MFSLLIRKFKACTVLGFLFPATVLTFIAWFITSQHPDRLTPPTLSSGSYHLFLYAVRGNIRRYVIPNVASRVVSLPTLYSVGPEFEY
jgi:hypothetical protein